MNIHTSIMPQQIINILSNQELQKPEIIERFKAYCTQIRRTLYANQPTTLEIFILTVLKLPLIFFFEKDGIQYLFRKNPESQNWRLLNLSTDKEKIINDCEANSIIESLNFTHLSDLLSYLINSEINGRKVISIHNMNNYRRSIELEWDLLCP